MVTNRKSLSPPSGGFRGEVSGVATPPIMQSSQHRAHLPLAYKCMQLHIVKLTMQQVWQE